jgi:hypothetical protein
MLLRILILAIFLTGCYKNHLYVQQEWFDRNSLASTKINTPDPRQEDPPEGPRLLVCWKFPRELFCEGLSLSLTVRFWDHAEETLIYPLEKARSHHIFPFYGKKILTYKIDVLTQTGEVIETWEHHFWTKWIEI